MTQNSINTGTRLMQIQSSSSSSLFTITGVIPSDNTIPQSSEGDQVLTVSITPSSSSSILVIDFNSALINVNATNFIVALFQDSTANALAAYNNLCGATRSYDAVVKHIMTSGTTSSTTFKIRVGVDSGSAYINGQSAGTRIMGGVANCILTVKEYL